MDLELIKPIIKEKRHLKATIEWNNGNTTMERLFVSSDDRLCHFKARSSKRGYPLSQYDVKNIILIEEKPLNPRLEWEKSLLKAKSMLEKSGLWKDNLETINTALSIGFDKMQQAYKQYNERFEGLDYYQTLEKNMILIKQIDERFVNSENSVDTALLWHFSNPLKIKKMNFGYNNQSHLESIKQALKDKQKIEVSGRTSYDVSFQYDGKERAWYSEEFKNCGNGHYYLALNETHAWHYEDD